MVRIVVDFFSMNLVRHFVVFFLSGDFLLIVKHSVKTVDYSLKYFVFASVRLYRGVSLNGRQILSENLMWVAFIVNYIKRGFLIKMYILVSVSISFYNVHKTHSYMYISHWQKTKLNLCYVIL